MKNPFRMELGVRPNGLASLDSTIDCDSGADIVACGKVSKCGVEFL